MEKRWWMEAVVYQIYPRSFCDSNGDGIGDLPGIISKIDYLVKLGVSVIWLCPVYRSPNDDNGYDISDYRDIMPEFGTLADWKELLRCLHAKGIRLVMDLVVNHTSDEHAWFVESRSSRDNPKRDWYIWRPGEADREPNDWQSFFCPSAWELDPTTDEYYLHLFSRKQPDLNWDNPAVRREVHDLMRFWLDLGIDGFRMDVINLISKVPGYPAVEPGMPGYRWGGKFWANGPRVHEYLREMNREVLSKYDIMTVGETPMVTVEDGLKYVGVDRGELNMLFQFDLMDIDTGPEGKWDIKSWSVVDFKRIMTRWLTGLSDKGWNSLFLNNHDQARMVSRFGDDGADRVVSAKMLATLLHTLPGTPYIYQGEEIGMTNVRFPRVEDYQDLEIHHFWREFVLSGKWTPERTLAAIHAKARDNARTPMQWSAARHAGFTAGTPWLGVNPNYSEINVDAALGDPDSVFHYYRRLIEMRKDNQVMVYGRFQDLDPEHPAVFAYIRQLEEIVWLVLINMTGSTVDYAVPGSWRPGRVVLSNRAQPSRIQDGRAALKPYEASIWENL